MVKKVLPMREIMKGLNVEIGKTAKLYTCPNCHEREAMVKNGSYRFCAHCNWERKNGVESIHPMGKDCKPIYKGLKD